MVRALLSLSLCLLPCLALTGCAEAQGQTAPEGLAPIPGFDAEEATDELAHVLAHYIQAPTINPTGHETLGAKVLAEVLDGEGIESEVWEHAPGRGNLIAKLPATKPSGEGAYCMLSHIDVVPAEEDKWTGGHGAFSGDIAPDHSGEMMVWGRGALDMKGLGAMQLMTLVWLKRLGIELHRDVVLIAVADEEVSNEGVQAVLAERWDELNCSHLINEGGMGLKDMLFEGQDVFAISVGEKGVLWLRMTADGAPGHGSTPREGEAPNRLLDALARLREYDPEPSYHPAMFALFDAIGAERSGVEGFVLTHPAATRVALKGTLMANPLTRAVMTDTLHITGLQGAVSPNVVPSEASALLDCRLLPGTTPDEMLERVKALVDDPGIRFEVLQSFEAGVSEWEGDPLYDSLATHVVAGLTDTVVGPAISPGFTDSIFVRPKGVRAYGLMPVRVNDELISGMHGNDERVPVAELGRGLHVLLHVALDVAAAEGAG